MTRLFVVGMSNQGLKRKPKVSSELLAAKIHGQDDKKINKATAGPANQANAAGGTSGQPPNNPVDPSK